MDHLSSRFRRIKKQSSPASPTTTLAGSPPDRSPLESKLNSGGQREPPSTVAPPTLTIPTGQPISNAPKSPFRRGFTFRHSNKRARSPAPPQPPPVPAIVSQDGTVEHDKSTLLKDDDKTGQGATEEKPKPKMPAFLNLSENEIEAKFIDLTWAERMRVQDSFSNPSPTYQFARIDSIDVKRLDRYANIQPWANNRVKLQVPEGQQDYINASPIVLRSPFYPQTKPTHRYIAMQGPKSITTDHVWRMVMEQLQSPAVIVMLTETLESGMEKCYQYFPKIVGEEWDINEIDEFGDGFRAQLSCVAVEDQANGAIEVRKLNIHVDGREEDMTVWHLLYRRWPDFGVPALEDVGSFLELMRLSREKNANEDNPRIIHCSAGVGRSGTFIALEHLMRELDSGDLDRYVTKEERDDGEDDIIYNTVNRLREQRRQMVQAESQYAFIYQVLRKLWLEKHGLAVEDIQEPAAKRLEVEHNPHDPFFEVQE
ncbi:phosphatases II [Hypoxylon rubiginosum]|uniref:Phosphatases II n=1 Tax=Hypoxylon rubiginosum TaxID=110542 RepID=A0ACB9YXF7_9PEZI|nr:phosphatases II [Hypoxylon rubiginosum]